MPVSRDIAAEAAVWVARLHGPDRSRAMEQECQTWQRSSAAHRLAFERCTDVWQTVPGITVSTYARATTGAPPARSNYAWHTTLAALALGAAGLLGWSLWPHAETYETGTSERRVIMLADGTRMTLNTRSDVRVDLTIAHRTVKVLRGEALFEVAKEPGRPFVVQVADATVVATGTTFLVRAEPKATGSDELLGVTLIEGQVIVKRSAVEGPLVTPVVMTPGERLRLTLSEGASIRSALLALRMDRPHIESVIAWQRGEAVFDSTPLSVAVAEMNRYSRVPIVLASEAVAALCISGVHRTGDNAAFANSVARLHRLTVRSAADHLELALPLTD